MKRMLCTVSAVASILVLMTIQGSSQTQPPRTNDEWQQQGQSSTQSSGTGTGNAGGSSSMMASPDFMRGPEDIQQRIAEMRQHAEQMQREAEERKNRAMQEMVGATDEQWRRIKPRLDRIEELKEQANASISPEALSGSSSSFFSDGRSFGGQWSVGFGGGGGGSVGGAGGPGRNRTWQNSWSTGTPQGRSAGGSGTETDRRCQELLGLLQNPNTPAPQIQQKVLALRQAREQARQQLTLERNNLRKQINPTQEPALVLMGYLD